MATFRFSVELGTDDKVIPPAEAERWVNWLRKMVASNAVQSLGTLYVSSIEVNPIAWDTGYEATVAQSGFPVLDPENVAKALELVFGHRPCVAMIEPADEAGIWLIPIPITQMSNLAAGRTDWERDDILVELTDFA